MWTRLLAKSATNTAPTSIVHQRRMTLLGGRGESIIRRLGGTGPRATVNALRGSAYRHICAALIVAAFVFSVPVQATLGACMGWEMVQPASNSDDANGACNGCCDQGITAAECYAICAAMVAIPAENPTGDTIEPTTYATPPAKAGVSRPIRPDPSPPRTSVQA